MKLDYPTDGGVIRLMTSIERAAKEQEAYEDRAHATAIRMLEDALAMMKAQTTRRTVGVVIGFVFNDRAYASHVPDDADNYSGLIAAASDIHYRLMKHTNGD